MSKRAVASWFETALARLLTMRVSHPKQPRIARLDLFRHFLDAGGVLLDQLDVGNLSASRLQCRPGENRILRREIDEEWWGFPRMQLAGQHRPTVGICRLAADAGKARD